MMHLQLRIPSISSKADLACSTLARQAIQKEGQHFITIYSSRRDPTPPRPLYTDTDKAGTTERRIERGWNVPGARARSRF
jgi:hypothetical protein